MKAHIVITIGDDGQVNVTGPSDKIIALGLLEFAKQAVLKHTEPRLVVPTFVPANGRKIQG